jgi:hypothetical protein
MTQHLAFESGLYNSGFSFSPNLRMNIVPQRPYTRTGGREWQEPIIFKVAGRLGIPVRDAIERTYAGLEGRDDQVFHNKAGVIMLRLKVRRVVGCEVSATHDFLVARVLSLVSKGEMGFTLAIDAY